MVPTDCAWGKIRNRKWYIINVSLVLAAIQACNTFKGVFDFQPKSKKSTKTSFWKIFEKGNPKMSQISVLIIYFRELDHSEWFGANNKKFIIFSNFDRWLNMAIFGHYGSMAKVVSFGPVFSQTWNFQGMFIAISSVSKVLNFAN